MLDHRYVFINLNMVKKGMNRVIKCHIKLCVNKLMSENRKMKVERKTFRIFFSVKAPSFSRLKVQRFFLKVYLQVFRDSSLGLYQRLKELFANHLIYFSNFLFLSSSFLAAIFDHFKLLENLAFDCFCFLLLT